MWNPLKKKPAEPEQRRIPAYVKDATPSESWITTRVFQYTSGGDKNDRVYYAAIKYVTGWEIHRIEYSLKKQGAFREGSPIVGIDSVEDALNRIARLDTKLENSTKTFPAYKGVTELAGNFREVANLCGGYFDENKNYIAAKKGEISQNEMVLSRNQLRTIFAENVQRATFRNWEDYQREVVKPWASEKLMVGSDIEAWAKKLNRLAEEKTPFFEKEQTLQDIQNLKSATRFEPEMRVYILTQLLSAGGVTYRQFVKSPTDTEIISLLRKISDTIDAYSKAAFGLSEEQSKQLQNLIMQGPNPYAGMPPIPITQINKKKPAV